MVSDVFDILKEESMNMDKFLWAHADEECHQKTIDLAYEQGPWIGFDNIHPHNHNQRAQLLQTAVDKGYSDRILLSLDLDMYDESQLDEGIDRMTSLFHTFLPKCTDMGIDGDLLHRMLTENPSNFYNIE